MVQVGSGAAPWTGKCQSWPVLLSQVAPPSLKTMSSCAALAATATVISQRDEVAFQVMAGSGGDDGVPGVEAVVDLHGGRAGEWAAGWVVLDEDVLAGLSGVGGNRDDVAAAALRALADPDVLDVGFGNVAQGVDGFDVVVDELVLLAGDHGGVAGGAVGRGEDVGGGRASGTVDIGDAGPRCRPPRRPRRFRFGRGDRVRAVVVDAPLERDARQAADVVGVGPDFEVARLGRRAPLHAAGVVAVRAAGRRRSGGVVSWLAGDDDLVGLGDGLVAAARDVAVPDFGAVPVPVVAGFGLQQVVPGFLGVGAGAGDDVVAAWRRARCRRP